MQKSGFQIRKKRKNKYMKKGSHLFLTEEENREKRWFKFSKFSKNYTFRKIIYSDGKYEGRDHIWILRQHLYANLGTSFIDYVYYSFKGKLDA